MYLLKDGESVIYDELSQSELNALERFVEISRHVEEIHGLFSVFLKNIEAFRSEYTLKNGGRIFRGSALADAQDDYIAINAHTINVISSGKTLVESMDCYIKTGGIEDSKKSAYAAFCSKIYDASFSYRLLFQLRNYAQHGHLPVSTDGKTYFFDLPQIIDKPHYAHNKTLKKQLCQINRDCIATYGQIPKIPLTESIAEFSAELLYIYENFWNFAECEFKIAAASFFETVEKYPGNKIGQDGENELFIYKTAGENVHAALIGKDSLKHFFALKKDAQKTYKDFEEAYKSLCEGNIFIRLSDGEISIGRGVEIHNSRLGAAR